MTEERPDRLLKSALEKIIYFEACSEQLGNDLASSRAEAERLRGDLGSAAQREIELRRQLAEHEVQIRRGQQNREELANVIDALKAERAELIGKLIEASRIHSSNAQEDAHFDLASFIAQLRSEALAVKPHHEAPLAQAMTEPKSRVEVAKAKLADSPMAVSAAQSKSGVVRGPSLQVPSSSGLRFMPSLSSAPSRAPASISKPALPMEAALAAPTSPATQPPLAQVSAPSAEPEPASAAPSATTQHAERLLAEGRLSVSSEQLEELAAKKPIAGRTEETLFGFSVRELSAPDAQARVRAAERLKVLGQPASAPALASALMTEQDPQVLVSFLSAFSALAKKEGAAVVARHLEAPVAEVRISALKALLVLDPGQAGPYLSAAMKDPEPSVRRRASLLALGLSPESALALGEQAVSDPSPEVRRLGALALGATAGEKARGLLLEAVNDSELKVRKVAAQSLSRLLGRDVSSLADLDAAQRRREVRKLFANPSAPAAVLGLPTPPAAVAVRPEARAEPARPAPAPAAPKKNAAPAIEEPLCAVVLSEVRCAIRGRTAAELCVATEKGPATVESACELLVARGQLVRRGKKYFAA